MSHQESSSQESDQSKIGLFVICAQDCNKHFPKIITCCTSIEDCIAFLNRKGKALICKDFDIMEHIEPKDPELPDDVSFSELSFEHKLLFESLYNCDSFQAICTHKGDIHILFTETGSNFDDIYDQLSTMYR